MFFRFTSALFLVVAISLAGIALEKQSLALRRSVSAQQYQLDALKDARALARLETQQLGAPERLLQAFSSGELQFSHPEKPIKSAQGRLPLPR